jgi:hypothetical protein
MCSTVDKDSGYFATRQLSQHLIETCGSARSIQDAAHSPLDLYGSLLMCTIRPIRQDRIPMGTTDVSCSNPLRIDHFSANPHPRYYSQLDDYTSAAHSGRIHRRLFVHAL